MVLDPKPKAPFQGGFPSGLEYEYQAPEATSRLPTIFSLVLVELARKQEF